MYEKIKRNLYVREIEYFNGTFRSLLKSEGILNGGDNCFEKHPVSTTYPLTSFSIAKDTSMHP